jgi:ribosomal protein S7
MSNRIIAKKAFSKLNQQKQDTKTWGKTCLAKVGPHENQGCQIFRGTTYQNGKNIPNGRKIAQMAQNIPTSSNARPSKIYCRGLRTDACYFCRLWFMP